MNIKYDESVDAMYIQFYREEDKAAFGFSYACDPSLVDGQIHLNFDSKGRIMGVEILGASTKVYGYMMEKKA